MSKLSNKPYVYAILAILIILVSQLIPPIAGLSKAAMYVLGVFIAVVFLWMTAGVTWPSAFGILAMAFTPGVTMNSIISQSVGNATVTFLIFTFCCSWALEQTQFVRRCAIRFLSIPIAATRPWIFLALYFASILVLGSFMSTTVIVIIYLTINEEIFSILGLKKGDKVASMITMGLIIVSGISGAITPIAHVFPLMAISLYEKATGGVISYLGYMIAAIPVGILCTAIMMLLFRALLKPDVNCLKDLDISVIQDGIKPADRKEKITVAVFLSVCALWILPELVSGILPGVTAWFKSYGTVLPPMVGAIILCIIPVDGKPIMNYGKALSSVPWPSLMMAASALCLGGLMSGADIGLTTALADALSPVLGNIAPFLFVGIMIFFAGFLTNIASNMVIVTLACTIAIPIAVAMPGVNVASLCAMIGMISSYAFATPAAMTTVVLGTGSGWTTTSEMAKYGFITLFFSCLLALFISYPIGALLI